MRQGEVGWQKSGKQMRTKYSEKSKGQKNKQANELPVTEAIYQGEKIRKMQWYLEASARHAFPNKSCYKEVMKRFF